MAILKTRNLPDGVHCAAVPAERARLGDALAQIGRAAKLSNQDLAVLENGRSSAPARPTDFE
jgi:plasmid stability protein